MLSAGTGGLGLQTKPDRSKIFCPLGQVLMAIPAQGAGSSGGVGSAVDCTFVSVGVGVGVGARLRASTSVTPSFALAVGAAELVPHAERHISDAIVATIAACFEPSFVKITFSTPW